MDEQLTSYFLQELELANLDLFVRQECGDEVPAFSELLKELFTEGFQFDWTQMIDYIKYTIFSGFTNGKGILTGILMLVLAFVVLQIMTELFSDQTIREFCFFGLYFLFLYQLLQLYLQLADVVMSALNRIVDFSMLIQPVFAVVTTLSVGVSQGMVTHQVLLLVIFIVQWLLQIVLFPAISVYLLVYFANYLWKEERLQKLGSLIGKGIQLALKTSFTILIGFHVIQGLLAPMLDQVKKNAFVKTLQGIPGLGGSIEAVTEILFSTGLLIKNCVGVAAILILAVLCLKPVIEVALFGFVCKLLSAVVEPVTDKRVSGLLQAMGDAIMLQTKILVSAMSLLLISLSLICVFTNHLA